MSRITYQPKNFVATSLTDIPFDQHRSYLSVVASSDVTIILQTPDGSSMTPFLLQAGKVWAPIPAPMNGISFSGTGTLIVG